MKYTIKHGIHGYYLALTEGSGQSMIGYFDSQEKAREHLKQI